MPKVVDHVHCRAPWERMMHIHARIRSGDHPNCTQLAQEFEVSSRTVKRDIDFMRCRLELAPLEGRTARGSDSGQSAFPTR